MNRIDYLRRVKACVCALTFVHALVVVERQPKQVQAGSGQS